jgi:hypothetical protein
MTSKVGLTRNQIYGMWSVITVLVLVLLLNLFKWSSPSPHGAPGSTQPSKPGRLILDGKRVPVSPELTAFLKQEGYPVILLPQEKGGIKIVNRTGGEIPPCKSQERETGVECPPFRKVDVEAIDRITILSRVKAGSDNCKDIRVNGNEVSVHNSGGSAGLAPCEPKKPHGHSAP